MRDYAERGLNLRRCDIESVQKSRMLRALSQRPSFRRKSTKVYLTEVPRTW